MRSLIYLPLAIAAVSAVPIEERQLFDSLFGGPRVEVSSGTIAGRSFLGIDTFNGIPYAQPPVGQLRLKPPQPYSGSYPGGVFNTPATAKSCYQGIGRPNLSNLPPIVQPLIGNLVDTISETSEDCLTLNIQRPAGTTSSSKLPVVFWIYGGAFTFGSTSTYDGSQLISTGVQSGHPFIFVAVNYRLNGFGFLAGEELQGDGSTNLGLRDQRLGLQWVADNIAAFGGDPSKVTLWGESAGAISATDHTVINGGDNTYKGKPLFRAAISNSGSITPTEPVDTPKAQNVYNAVVSAAGCAGSSNTLACLRSISASAFADAINSVPGAFSYRSVDIAYIPRPDPASNFFSRSPEMAFRNGAYARVPVITGDQEDEGTLFSLTQNNITTTDELVKYMQSYFPVRGANLMAGLVATYPDDPSAGSPFRTGASNNIYPQYKRLAAILGDLVFTLLRRAYLNEICDTVPTWSFLDTHLYGTPVLGTYHANDVFSIFFGLADANVVSTYRNAVISFAYYQDPNRIVDLKWPQWKRSNRQLLNIDNGQNKLLTDDFRSQSYNFLSNAYGQIRI